MWSSKTNITTSNDNTHNFIFSVISRFCFSIDLSKSATNCLASLSLLKIFPKVTVESLSPFTKFSPGLVAFSETSKLRSITAAFGTNF